MTAFFETYLRENGLAKHGAAFDTYYDMLTDWNTRMNLTAVTERAEAEKLHFVDSLAGMEFMGESVLDVGAGAGFPSLPLAIVCPEKRFVLADSLLKRVGFLNAVIEALGLTNARAVHCRAEDLPRAELYDTVTARAVAPLGVLCEYCLPFVKIGGRMVAYKAEDVDDEARAAEEAVRILGGGGLRTERRTLYGTDIVRAFVLVEKRFTTPKKYPRGGNKPRLDPLGKK